MSELEDEEIPVVEETSEGESADEVDSDDPQEIRVEGAGPLVRLTDEEPDLPMETSDGSDEWQG